MDTPSGSAKFAMVSSPAHCCSAFNDRFTGHSSLLLMFALPILVSPTATAASRTRVPPTILKRRE